MGKLEAGVNPQSLKPLDRPRLRTEKTWPAGVARTRDILTMVEERSASTTGLAVRPSCPRLSRASTHGTACTKDVNGGRHKMPRSLEDFAVFAAPAVFVLLWSSGFIGAKFGLGYAEPLTFSRSACQGGRAPRPRRRADAAEMAECQRAFAQRATGLMVHGLYLGGVFVSIENGLPAGLAALFVSLQPVLTSTVANRWLGERVVARQWLGLALGLVGVYLVLHDKSTTGEATPLAWTAMAVGLIGITVGTLYQKRFGGGIDWRPAFFVQYAAAGRLFFAGAFSFETRVVHLTPEFVFALAISLSCCRSVRCGSCIS